MRDILDSEIVVLTDAELGEPRIMLGKYYSHPEKYSLIWGYKDSGGWTALNLETGLHEDIETGEIIK